LRQLSESLAPIGPNAGHREGEKRPPAQKKKVRVQELHCGAEKESNLIAEAVREKGIFLGRGGLAGAVRGLEKKTVGGMSCL